MDALRKLQKIVASRDLEKVASLIKEAPYNSDELGYWLTNQKVPTTSLHYAARHGLPELIPALLKVIPVETRDKDGKTALHEAASAGHLQCLAQLLKHGAAVDALKRADWTPLMMSCSRSHKEITSELLSHGANAKLLNQDGWNSFHIATREGNLEILKLLLSHDATCWKTESKNKRTPLHTAALHGHGGVIRFLLDSGFYDINVKDSCGNTPLLDSVRKGYIQCVEIFIQHGSDLYVLDSMERGLIHIASESGQLEILSYLHNKLKLQLNNISTGGTTPLHLAVKEGHYEIVRKLIELNVDHKKTDIKQRTALDLARLLKRDEIVTLFENSPEGDCEKQAEKKQCTEKCSTETFSTNRSLIIKKDSQVNS